MNRTEDYYKEIVTGLQKHPRRAEIIDLAYQITDIVFEIRMNSTMEDLLKQTGLPLSEVPPESAEKIKGLITSFRSEIGPQLKENPAISDSQIYAKIILPLIIAEINQAV